MIAIIIIIAYQAQTVGKRSNEAKAQGTGRSPKTRVPCAAGTDATPIRCLHASGFARLRYQFIAFLPSRCTAPAETIVREVPLNTHTTTGKTKPLFLFFKSLLSDDYCQESESEVTGQLMCLLSFDTFQAKSDRFAHQRTKGFSTNHHMS